MLHPFGMYCVFMEMVCSDCVGSLPVQIFLMVGKAVQATSWKDVCKINEYVWQNESVALLRGKGFLLEELLYSAACLFKTWRRSVRRQRQCSSPLIGWMHLLLCCHCSLLFWLWNSRAWRGNLSSKTTPNSVCFTPAAELELKSWAEWEILCVSF